MTGIEAEMVCQTKMESVTDCCLQYMSSCHHLCSNWVWIFTCTYGSEWVSFSYIRLKLTPHLLNAALYCNLGVEALKMSHSFVLQIHLKKYFCLKAGPYTAILAWKIIVTNLCSWIFDLLINIVRLLIPTEIFTYTHTYCKHTGLPHLSLSLSPCSFVSAVLTFSVSRTLLFSDIFHLLYVFTAAGAPWSNQREWSNQHGTKWHLH